MEKAQKRSTRT